MVEVNRNAILERFHGYGSTKQLIGGEYERAIVRPDGGPVTYDEPFGIRWFLTQFATRWGWSPYLEGQNVIALRKGGASITLEPGGQFELSGKAHASLADLHTEFALNRQQVNQLAKEAGFVAITCGLTPITAVENIGWMPKGRYQIMRDYLPNKGDLALFMMKGTTSVQCNYDYRSEEDCARKVKLCAGVAPLTTALFANSPLYRNRPTGFQSFRGHIWTRTDPDRTGFPAGLRDDFSFERWVDYLLDVPMMFIHKNNDWIPAQGSTFRQYMTSGLNGHFPNWSDWELHMTSTFPEVRIKSTIEVRGADCVRHDLAVGFCALFTGLLYNESALEKGLDLASEFSSYGSRESLFDLACRSGLAGTIGERRLADWTAELISIAQAGLKLIEPSAVELLTPLMQQANSGESPATQLLNLWSQDPTPQSVVSALAY